MQPAVSNANFEQLKSAVFIETFQMDSQKIALCFHELRCKILRDKIFCDFNALTFHTFVWKEQQNTIWLFRTFLNVTFVLWKTVMEIQLMTMFGGKPAS